MREARRHVREVAVSINNLEIRVAVVVVVGVTVVVIGVARRLYRRGSSTSSSTLSWSEVCDSTHGSFPIPS